VVAVDEQLGLFLIKLLGSFKKTHLSKINHIYVLLAPEGITWNMIPWDT
jgi:hypothetical protein